MKSIISLILVLCVSWLTPVFCRTKSNQEDQQAEKIKSQIEKIGVRQDITVVMKDGKKYHGFVSRIGDEDFDIAEVDRKTTLTVRYSEVKKASKGYGQKGPLGNRVGRKGRLIGTIIGITVAVVIPVIIAGSVKD
ncbi:MAG: hypothetical protein AB1631_12390 [Acidobacteriota bacterium]